ncbi:MAG: 2'-5' RNA ligase family protein [Candidatus Rifleibacteriota bacterium]
MSKDNQKSLPYTLAFRVPLDLRRFIAACNRKLSEVCRSFEPIETAHITVKFLGHSSDHLNEETVIEYLPEIHRIARKYMPMTLYLRGFSTFQYEEGRSAVIFLKVLPSARLTSLHHEICDKFAGIFDIFPHAEHENFEPHLTLSKDVFSEKSQQIARIVARSHKMAKRMVKLDDLVVMSPSRLFPVVSEITTPLICPPVR